MSYKIRLWWCVTHYLKWALNIEGNMSELELMQVGGFKELSKLSNPHRYELLYIPSLEAVLLKMEKDKGAPLSEEEVKYYTDNCTVIAVDEAKKKAVLDRIDT